LAKLNLLSPNSPFLRLFLIIVFFATASLIPFIGLVFLMTLPLVLFVLSIFNDPTKTLTAFLAALFAIMIFLSFFMHAAIPVFALVAMGLAGIMMAWITRQNYPIELIVLLPSLVIMGGVTSYFVYGGTQLSIGPLELIEKYIKEAVELNIQFYSRMPLSPEEISSIQENKPAVVQLLTRIFPALCVIAVLFTTWINVLMGNKLLHRHGINLPNLSALSEWRAPDWLVWIFIGGGGLSFVPHTYVSYVGINLFMVASFIYLLQGLAIVSFFFNYKNLSIFFRWFFYFLIAIQQMLMIAIAALGFFDIWIDFRKYLHKDQETD
jgi:uncharacterized protein YybS (DUF2232 family)